MTGSKLDREIALLEMAVERANQALSGQRDRRMRAEILRSKRLTYERLAELRSRQVPPAAGLGW